MTPADLATAVLAAARDVFDGRGLDPAVVPAGTSVERPRNPEHGDYASTIALQLARPAGLAARDLAEAIAARLRSVAGIGSVDVAGPGFLNIRLDAAATGDLARVVAEQGPAYGRGRGLTGQRLNLEFVSANPTGPLHTGAVRWAAVGDALARLLRASGAEVITEYYFNDAGAQIERFARSLLATARGEPIPEDGYAGPYIADLAAAVVAKHPDAAARPDAEARETFRVEGVAMMFDEIKTSLAAFGVHFDVYFNEKDLHVRGELDAALARLREQGHVYESGGAVWLRTTDFDDDRDRVLVRSIGGPTYFLADCAYYLDKRERGFDRVVIMLGADHHGYIGRMRAMAACFGDDPDRSLEILIGQMVNLVREGQPVRMSKRAGTYVTLEDLVEAMGVDASRYALARYSFNSPIDLDLDLWTRAAPENPVYYVQYAHARIASMQRHAAELGITRGDDFDPGLLSHEREGDLLRTLGQFPAVVATAAELREPHRVARYLEELAGVLHKFYDTDACRVLPRAQPGPPSAQLAIELTQARLWLVEAARIVFVNGLGLLGVTAPDRM